MRVNGQIARQIHAARAAWIRRQSLLLNSQFNRRTQQTDIGLRSHQNLQERDDGFDGYLAVQIHGGEYLREIRIPPDLDSVPERDVQDDFGKFAAARGDNTRYRTRLVRVRLQGDGNGIICLLLIPQDGET